MRAALDALDDAASRLFARQAEIVLVLGTERLLHGSQEIGRVERLGDPGIDI